MSEPTGAATPIVKGLPEATAVVMESRRTVGVE
jgi:hypothetical protein